MELFGTALLDSVQERNTDLTPKPVGHLVQRLDLLDDDRFWIQNDEPDLDRWDTPLIIEFTTSMHIILLHLPALRYFMNPLRHQWVASKLSQVAALARCSQESLTTLSISLAENDNGVFRAINSLKQLCCLEIRINSSTLQVDIRHRPAPWTHDVRYALRIPTLKHLIWKVCRKNPVTPSMVGFLGASRIGFGCKVELDLRLEPGDVPLFLPFLTENTFDELSYPFIHTGVQALMAAALMRIPKLEIVGYSPSCQLVHQKTFPTYLSISYSCAGYFSMPEEENQFWSFIRALQDMRRPLTAPCTIMVDSSAICPGSLYTTLEWPSFKQPLYAGFIQRLLPIAQELGKNNIRITDGFELDGVLPPLV